MCVFVTVCLYVCVYVCICVYVCMYVYVCVCVCEREQGGWASKSAGANWVGIWAYGFAVVYVSVDRLILSEDIWQGDLSGMFVSACEHCFPCLDEVCE